MPSYAKDPRCTAMADALIPLLDGAEVRTTLLDTVVRLALLLRWRHQAARGLMLTLKFAGGGRWEKTRRLTEPSAHDDDLRTAAYQGLPCEAGGQCAERILSDRHADVESGGVW
ncbi:hypothetical protein ABTZ58_37410 [Streptomyces sp. NPDC094143]|uniref:DinB/UmuC family translesion DNA polymerase n=1 Tax=Streptomyces sp. NPDC094143 TaxID=3155310 RepID=UPI003322E289